MSSKPYTLHINEDNSIYQFQSIGKRGTFEKVIIISLLGNPCNLALLDYDPVTDEYTDLSVTDNGDMKEGISDRNAGHKVISDCKTKQAGSIYR
ncbi:DUF6934 family protein [Dyadobacter frigoris]|uniref:Uncharacterized protein n=1 Tax=Dyadobacter frigoris TaxID=2576211 RepID=A0A4U6D7L2_9BACT|nr:hypothetical protein [Dyadobacter frigoris]TKT92128.1 hypothetical protein FDK13_13430 [Dyadobacter frigoris]GLU52983.1 hypothetical protein Dfri01_24440 [Dyadobacter frigoris]